MTQLMASGPSGPFLTVGQLREEMHGLPDDAQIVVTSSFNHTYDQGVVQVLYSSLIPWNHDCTDDDDKHMPGRDCPTDHGLELWLNSYDEAVANAGDDL